MSDLLIDIETGPCEGFFWRPGYKLTISEENVTRRAEIICISYKNLNEGKVKHLKWEYGAKHRDKEMLGKFTKILSKADSIIAHNGNQFDIPWIRTQLMCYRLPPLPAISVVDTLKLVRGNFNFSSNSLNNLAKRLGVIQKKKTDFELWKRVMRGEKKALKEMVEYCDQDILVLEQVYNILEKYCPQMICGRKLKHFDGKCVKPDCEGTVTLNGRKKTPGGGWKQRYMCNECMVHYTSTKTNYD